MIEIEKPSYYQNLDNLEEKVSNIARGNWFARLIPNFGMRRTSDYFAPNEIQQMIRAGVNPYHAGGVFPKIGLDRIKRDLLAVAPNVDRQIADIELNNRISDRTARLALERELESRRQLAEIELENQKELLGLQSKDRRALAEMEFANQRERDMIKAISNVASNRGQANVARQQRINTLYSLMGNLFQV